jgi:hypothetical protein
MMSSFTSGLTYRRERLRAFIVHWVTMHHRPMSIVGDPKFLDIVNMLNPHVAVNSSLQREAMTC